jgi:riboflavin synthase
VFTGIIEEMGVVGSARASAGGARLVIRAEAWDGVLRVGESVAVHGACLTVAAVDGPEWAADLSPETLRRTTLGALRAGDRVHLERAVRLGDRMGGHLVAGHVDEVGRIASVAPLGDGRWMGFAVSPANGRYLIEKGSVAVDGVSLTVAELTPHGFAVALIPVTLRKTTLGSRAVGGRVNIEFDMIAKYVERLITQQKAVGSLSRDFLAEHGFLP